MANRILVKRRRFQRRKRSVRKDIFGTKERPRLSVYRSVQHIYAQIIDDSEGRTICASSTVAKDVKGKLSYGGNKDAAKLVGEDLAAKALAIGIDKVVFDRNGFKYQGRLQALADAAREKGLKF